MIVVDANLLIYANADSMPQHAAVRRWLVERLNCQAKVGLAWSSVLAFLRLVTNPRVFEPPLSVAQAWGQVETWLEIPVEWIPQVLCSADEHFGRFPGLRWENPLD